MPDLDGTGPPGKGTLTGRRKRKCRSKLNDKDLKQGSGFRNKLPAKTDKNIFGRQRRYGQK